MKKLLVPLGMAIALASAPLTASAQSYWLLSYKGTATSGTNGTALVSKSVSEGDLIHDCAGTGSTSNLALVLHLNAEDLGDRIEVINTNDPNAFRCDKFKLFFQQNFTNTDGTVVKKFAYIFTDQSDHNAGSAIFTQKVVTPRNNQSGTNHLQIDGTMQFWLTNDSGAVEVNTGSFTSRGPLSNLP